MHEMKLHYTPNANPRLAVAVAKYLNSPVKFVRARPRDPAHQEAFRPLNPNTFAPVLEEQSGPLWETDAIACRLSMLAKSDFWVAGPDMPEMIRWISWTGQHFIPAAAPAYFERVVLPTFSTAAPDHEIIAKSLAAFSELAAILDGALEGKTWLVGDKLSYADFRTATYLPYAAQSGFPVADFPNVARWNAQLEEIKAWRDPFDGLAMD